MEGKAALYALWWNPSDCMKAGKFPILKFNIFAPYKRKEVKFCIYFVDVH